DLARLAPNDSLRPALEKRERQLRYRYQAAWRRELPGGARRGEFERGFLVPSKEMATRTFLEQDDAYFRVAPLWKVRLAWSRGRMPELASCPHLRCLSALSLWDRRLSDEGLVPLVHSPHLAN